MSQLWLHITAGEGPVECALAVVLTMREIEQEARAAALEFQALEVVPGPEPGTAHSVLLSLSGAHAEAVAGSWRGTVQWIFPSPYRAGHKRKNWFVGIGVLIPVEETRLGLKELRWETMRASGPGGQHVNRTESAVRVTHLPTGLQAAAMEERSQHRNRKLALARLAQKIEEANAGLVRESMEARWRGHRQLERGNPVRVFRA